MALAGTAQGLTAPSKLNLDTNARAGTVRHLLSDAPIILYGQATMCSSCGALDDCIWRRACYVRDFPALNFEENVRGSICIISVWLGAPPRRSLIPWSCAGWLWARGPIATAAVMRAIRMLAGDWRLCCELWETRSQHVIISEKKKALLREPHLFKGPLKRGVPCGTFKASLYFDSQRHFDWLSKLR